VNWLREVLFKHVAKQNDILTPTINLKYHLWVEKTDRNLSLWHPYGFFHWIQPTCQ